MEMGGRDADLTAHDEVATNLDKSSGKHFQGNGKTASKHTL
jgi:hypothetical protein